MNREEIEHFRPRSRFPDQSFDWLNLVYSCHRCNQAKGDNWPGFDDGLLNQLLAAENSRYAPASEYVNPNASTGQRSAIEFFSFDIDTGEIMPAEQLSTSEWSMARRTIRDFDLNDSNLGENDPNHLWRLRRTHLDLIRTTVNDQDDDELAFLILQEFTFLDSPFSSFILAYADMLSR